MTRTFVAVELEGKVLATLEQQIARLRRALPEVRWAEVSSLHLTLAFLGELDDAKLAAATEAAAEVAVAARPFTLQVAGLGTFGPSWAPRVVWAGLAGEMGALLALQRRLVLALEACGFPREERPFAPHLTLARLKQPLGAEALARLTAILQAHRTRAALLPVKALAVMQSELLRSGARYTCLRACALGEHAPD